MKSTIRYKKTTIRIKENPRKGMCMCCLKFFQKTDMHHWIYAYETKEVKKNPELALNNTTELCYHCHLFANALKKCTENELITNILKRIQREVNEKNDSNKTTE